MSQITVLRSNTTKVKNYEVCEVSYRTDEGKTKGMKILSFLSPDIFAVAKEVKEGDVLDVTFKQNDKGYWEFNSMAKTAEAAQKHDGTARTAAAPATKAGGSNWETSAERAARQVYIVRQSSLATAVELLNAAGKAPTAKDTIAVARELEAYVFEQPTKDVE